MGEVSRREFAVAAAGALLGGARVQASERVRLGFIGVGNRGSQLLTAALAHADAEVVAFCDLYKPYLERAQQRVAGAKLYADFRQVIDRKDIDAIVIATPDHWHAIQTIAACEAGKDVYVEKPLAITIHEGRRMVEAARRTKRIAQVGLMRRSSTLFPEIAKLVQSDGIGKVTIARAYRVSNMWPNGIGLDADSAPPADLDWDMWLGPRPKRPFNKNIAPYKFRWWKQYSSQVANWGVHYFDLIRWLTGDVAPASVSAHGGKFAVNDARDIPDTMEAIFEMPAGRLMLFGQYEASGVPVLAHEEIELRGTRGCLYADTESYQVIPEQGGQFQERKRYMEPISGEGHPREKATDLDRLHMRNFLDCVKSRKTPNCDIEEGHRSTIFAHLANIALATRSRIDWDAAAERITNNTRANELLSYPYRAPWKLG